MEKLLQSLGISSPVQEYSQKILAGLAERFEQIDAMAEYNQLKVIKAMQDAREIGRASCRERV